MNNKWIQKIKLKKGSLSRQLGVPIEKNIPRSLLRSIIFAKSGTTIRNPTSIGKPTIKVTRLVERRANLALNLKNIKRR